MNLLLHLTDFPIQLKSEFFLNSDIKDFFSKVEPTDYLYLSNREEFYLNAITESLDQPKFQGVKSIVIDKNLGGSGWGRAINLAAHIRCSNFTKSNLNEVPIILTDRDPLNLEDSSIANASVFNFFHTEGFYFRSHSQIFIEVPDKISGIIQPAINNELRKLKGAKFDKITLRPPIDNRHQSTNEWGAMRLASNFGLLNLIKFQYPKHLYFKYIYNYLPKSSNETVDQSLRNLFTNVLLIDDNADHGWQESLMQIFSCNVDKRISISEVLAWQNTTPDKFCSYDLIFLDLYLEKGKQDTTASVRILRFIKSKYPHIPIVIFTASDKAWNMDLILESGADAMYIKESPIFFQDPKYSLDNYKDFKTTVKYIKDKYRILKPYWISIQRILSNNNFNSLENTPRKIRGRIEERFKMFYGLLKKGYEQWDYDKATFYYSDYELAFITLWSILNEIQEANYEKNDRTPQILADQVGNHISKQPDGTTTITPIPGFNWIIKNQQEYFLKHEFQFEGFSQIDGTPLTKRNNNGKEFYKIKSSKIDCALEYDNRVSPFYKNGLTINRQTFHKELSNQIAFLILNKNDLRTTLKKDDYLIKLKELTEVRNHLYLTHGETSNSYYTQTEQDKRNSGTYNITPEKEIKRLFDLIDFLLTGNEVGIIL